MNEKISLDDMSQKEIYEMSCDDFAALLWQNPSNAIKRIGDEGAVFKTICESFLKGKIDEGCFRMEAKRFFALIGESIFLD